MSEQLAITQPLPAELAEKVFIGGDLKSLNPAERLLYYTNLCESLRVNPLSRPFEYITLNGRLTLYGTKELANQLRRRDNVSITDVDTRQVGDLIVVTVKASTPGGRTDVDIGVVNIRGEQDEKLANSMLRCITKAKRRVTLSICGVGFLDETEVDSIPGARREVSVTSDSAGPQPQPEQLNTETGEITPAPIAQSRHTAIEQSSDGWRITTIAGLRAYAGRSTEHKRIMLTFIRDQLGHADGKALEKMSDADLLRLSKQFPSASSIPALEQAQTEPSPTASDDDLVTVI